MATAMVDSGIRQTLEALKIKEMNEGTSTGSSFFSSGEVIESFSPVDGSLIAKVRTTTRDDYEAVMAKATEAFKTWRLKPAPQRGEIVRQFGQRLRELKEPLGKLVSYEMGKSYQEGLGEVQEMIDICDFAVGLSRQLHGLTMHSERPGHRMYEQYHPLGMGLEYSPGMGMRRCLCLETLRKDTPLRDRLPAYHRGCLKRKWIAGRHFLPDQRGLQGR